MGEVIIDANIAGILVTGLIDEQCLPMCGDAAVKRHRLLFIVFSRLKFFTCVAAQVKAITRPQSLASATRRGFTLTLEAVSAMISLPLC